MVPVKSVTPITAGRGHTHIWALRPMSILNILTLDSPLLGSNRLCHAPLCLFSGNSGSAFVELQVGSSMWPPDQEYKTLLPSTTFMKPAESKTWTHTCVVRMFNEGNISFSWQTWYSYQGPVPQWW